LDPGRDRRSPLRPLGHGKYVLEFHNYNL
jgi:hypothetical protein